MESVCCLSSKVTCTRHFPCSNGPWASVTRQTLPVFPLLVAPPLGAVYTLAGRVADAVPLLTQVTAQMTAMDAVSYQAVCQALGEAYVQAGRLEEAHTLAERTLESPEHQERGNEAYALRLLGDITARRGPPEHEQAAAYYQQALALAGEPGMRPLLAHCHRGLGTLYATIGQQEQARTELSAAIVLYRAMDMTFWLPPAAGDAGAGGDDTNVQPWRTVPCPLCRRPPHPVILRAA